MVATRSRLSSGYDDWVEEWVGVDNDSATPYIAVGPRTDVTVQLMEDESGDPTIGVQVSLSLDSEAPVWGAAHLVDGTTAIAITTVGEVAAVLESGVLIRPLRTAGTGTGRVRIKATRIR